MEIFHSTDITLSLGMGVGRGQGLENFLLVSVSSNPLFAGRVNFSGSLAFFGSLAFSISFVKFAVFQVPQSLLRDWLQIAHRVVRKLISSLFCLFIIIIILIIISIYFVVQGCNPLLGFKGDGFVVPSSPTLGYTGEVLGHGLDWGCWGSAG